MLHLKELVGWSRFWRFDTSSFSDIFEDFFGDFGGGGSTRRSSNRGNDLRYDVSISLEDAFKGIEKNVKYTTYKSCSSCSGSGAAKGSKPIKCDYCSGRGKVRTNQGFLQFNKHVLSVVAMVKQLVNHVIPVVVTVKFKLMKM